MSNQAAWIMEKQGKPLKVDTAPMPTPLEADEILIRNHAAAINPADWKIQQYGVFVQSFPYILGEDVAGEVVDVGSAVKRFKKGDRVIAHSHSLVGGTQRNSGFQLYVATLEILAAKLPANISYIDGVVMPLALSTAAVVLFQKNHFGSPYPKKDAPPNGKVILVWGGSSSCGSAGLQLAAAAGFEVATTASAHNHAFVQSLGAKYVFDHNKASVVDDIVATLSGKGQFAGVYDAISTPDTIQKSAAVASKLGGRKFVATVLPPTVDVPEGVELGLVNALHLITEPHKHVADAIWGTYIPAALADGTLKCKPDPLVIGKGLESVQKGMDKLKEGVSAKKLVVDLS